MLCRNGDATHWPRIEPYTDMPVRKSRQDALEKIERTVSALGYYFDSGAHQMQAIDLTFLFFPPSLLARGGFVALWDFTAHVTDRFNGPVRKPTLRGKAIPATPELGWSAMWMVS